MRFLYIVLFLFTVTFSNGQEIKKTYKINPWVDGSIIAGATALTFWGLNQQDSQSDLSTLEVYRLNPDDVNAFDRRAIYKDTADLQSNLNSSDIALNVVTASAVLLAFDKRVRAQWVEALVLYIETLSINSATQAWVAYGTNRYRPLAYMDIPIEQRIDSRNKNSFYSGHTSSAATSSFYIAKVLNDLHPEWGKRRVWLFAVAVIPPFVIGNFRIGAGKHFYTDVLVGTAMGAATSVLTLELHKVKIGNGMSLRPIIRKDVLGMYCKISL